MNKPLIVANWKLYPTNSKDAFDLALAVKKGVENSAAQVVLCPPFVYIGQLLAADNVALGSQDCFWKQEGAYTGEVSPLMIKNLGCSYVILGHSERRNTVQESNEQVAQKVRAALEVGLVPVLCIGEKEKGQWKKSLQTQLQFLQDVPLQAVVFAYEPEWAISSNSTSEPDTPENVAVVVKECKEIVGQDTMVLYGGSVTEHNVQGFIQQGKADGVLVGSASLDAERFVTLVKNATVQ